MARYALVCPLVFGERQHGARGRLSMFNTCSSPWFGLSVAENSTLVCWSTKVPLPAATIHVLGGIGRVCIVFYASDQVEACAEPCFILLRHPKVKLDLLGFATVVRLLNSKRLNYISDAIEVDEDGRFLLLLFSGPGYEVEYAEC